MSSAASLFLVIIAGMLLCMVTWLPREGVWAVSLNPRLPREGVWASAPAAARLLSNESQLHAEWDALSSGDWDALAATVHSNETNETNETAFVVPQWKPRCDLNRTKFMPECLPEPIFARRDWRFAELCGSEYAAAKVKNPQSKGKAHVKVFTLLYDNIVATMLHFISGMAMTGIFLRRRKMKTRPQQDESASDGSADNNDKPVTITIKSRIMAYLYVASTTCSLLYAMGACLLTLAKFWRRTFEYAHGVWVLPPHTASYHCKSIMLQEFLYYKDLLGYLTLSSFTVMDFFIVSVPILTWLGLTTHFCCESAVCLPLFFCLKGFFTCAWWPAVVACLSCIVAWLCDMCAACCEQLRALCSNLYWLFIQCGWWKGLQLCCASCCNSLNYCCWSCGYCLTHLSCACFCNVCLIFKVALLLLLVLTVELLLLPVAVYLSVGVLVYAACHIVVIMLVLLPLLMGFWAITQLVTAACLMKECLCKSDNPPEFMGPCEYYVVYARELLLQVVESLPCSPDLEQDEEIKASLPDTVRQAVGYMELGSKDNRMVNGFLPACMVLSLLVGSAIMSGGTISIMHVLGGYDLGWIGEKADKPDFLDEKSLRYGNLTTVAGVRVPEHWPVLSGWGFKDRCTCLECSGHTLVTDIGSNTTCGPAQPPRELAPGACSAGLTAEDELLLTMRAVDGLKRHGHVFEGQQQYVGLGTKVRPTFLDTYALKVDHPPRKGCYGLLLPSDNRLNGWCNCSSGSFVPVAIDVVYQADGWPFSKVYKHTNRFMLESARDTPHAMSEQAWVEQQKVYQQEKWNTYISESDSIHWARFWSSWLGLFGSVTDVLKALFGTFWDKWELVVTHFQKTWRWIANQFYALRNFTLALTAWLHSQDWEDFEEVAKIVIFGRSIAAMMTGMARAIVQVKELPYSALPHGD